MTHSPDTPATPEGDAISRALPNAYYECAGCTQQGSESNCRPSDDIRLAPDETWLCEYCYDDAAYECGEDANWPVWADLPKLSAALRSLPPQDGEREKLRCQLKTARKIIAKVYGRVALVVSELVDEDDKVSFGSTNHADILRDLDQEWAESTILKADILTSEQEAAAFKARAEKAEARVAELENALDSRGKELTAAWHRIEGLTAQPVAQDLAPEATEACAEQTEIVIKALQAAKREIDPRFAGHHENIGFAIRRLRCLTQSFQDACRENDALRTRATPAPVEAGDLDALMERLKFDRNEAPWLNRLLADARAAIAALRAQSAPVGGEVKG